MDRQLRIFETPHFQRAVKRLKANQKTDLDIAIKKIADNPAIGSLKKGNLSHVRVYKFNMVGQLPLLAYHFEAKELILELLHVGSHENFYRNLENQERRRD
ncbi:type II toxin-antitoxin system RelE/ParE family toxin [Endozoicomonas sp. ONNA2]|uniref:type II toxin-antitoxin system RelE/ParE family toxin n=1 Tax=Endozoicomonas sp. ONNA2 TaxID=2828741 RepID=UPI0021483978|nr:type II toxin-antitoxin system RelE/ParE family toxin [Endozoicomonas sp. ONNA2]